MTVEPAYPNDPWENYVAILDNDACTLIVKKVANKAKRDEFVNKARDNVRGNAKLVLFTSNEGLVDGIAHLIDEMFKATPPIVELIDPSKGVERH